MEKLGKISINVIKVVSFLLFFWIVVLMLFFSNVLDYSCKREFLTSNIILIIFATLGYLGIKYISSKKDIKIKVNFDRVEKIALVILFILEIYISYNIFFETGWDSGFGVIPGARDLLNGTTGMIKGDYFSGHPNNVFIVNVYYVILKLNRTIGIFTGDYELMSIIVVNCFIASMSCHLIYRLCKKHISEIYAMIAFFVAVVLIGLSPWMVICYSDSLALFVPILIIYIYDSKLNYIVKAILISLLGYLGYWVKPQVAIVLVAIVIVEIIKLLCKQSAFKPKKLILIIMIFTLTCGTLSIGLNSLYHQEGFPMDHSMEIGITHYFMMGLNPKSGGVYNDEDAANSAACKTVEERRNMNLSVAQKRLQAYGPIGYFQFLSRKMLTNYNDGTFAWGIEGHFYYQYKTDLNTGVSGRLKSLYYSDWNTNKYKLFSTTEQFLWLIIIVLCFAKTIFELKKEEKDYYHILLILSLIGITMFELLFEARARYLYIYAPLYVVVAISGLKDLQKLKLFNR